MADCEITPDEVLIQIESFAKELTPAEKRFFDTWMIGSLFRQDGALKTKENRINERAREENWSEKARLKALDAARKEYWRTNLTKFGFGLDVVDPNTVAEYGQRYNEIIQATLKEDLSDNDVRSLFNRAKVDEAPAMEKVLPGSSTLNEGPAIEAFSDSFLDRVWQISEDAEKAGLFSGKGGPENARKAEQIKDILRRNPNLRHHFADLFTSMMAKLNESRGGVGVSPTRASAEEIDVFLKELKRIDRGSALAESLKGKPVKWYHYFFFPDAIGRLHDPLDQVRTRQLRLVLTDKGPKEMEIFEYNSSFSTVQNFMQQALDAMDGENSKVTERVVERFRFIHGALGTDAPRFFEAVVAKMELDGQLIRSDRTPETEEVLKKEWEKHKDDYEKLTAEEYLVPLPGEGRKKISGKELAERLASKIEEHTKEDYARFVVNEEGEKKFLKKDKDGNIDVKKSLSLIQRHFEKTGRFPEIGIQGLQRLMYEIKLQERFRSRFQEQAEKNALKYSIDKDGEISARESPATREDVDRFSKAIMDELRAAEPFQTIGRVDYGYFPHMNWPRATVTEHMKKRLKKAIMEGADEATLLRIESQIRRAYGDGTLKDDDLTDDIRGIIAGGKSLTEEVREGPINIRPGNTFGRSDDMMPGWDKSQRVLEMYGHKMNGAYHKMMGALMSDQVIRNFEERKPFGETTEAWGRFMRMYVSRAIGHPSLFPKEYLEDKNLSLYKKPYWVFTDQFMEEKLRSIDTKFFGRKLFESEKNLLGNKRKHRIEGFSEATPGDPRSMRFQRKLAWLSNLEAKWQMLSLLARTKSFVNNLTGSQNTAISVGYGPFMKAMSLRYLRDNILDENGNPFLNSWDDVRRFVEEHGGVESFIIDETGIRGRLDTANVRAWLSESKAYLKKKWADGLDGNDRDLKEIRDKYGITKEVMNAAGWFMRASERTVRMHAFMAHYIKAREALEANGFVMSKDHPWLIEMARRGTTATQFMYSAAYRPAFAASSFGKIIARFQVWAWNSMKFRRDIYRQAETFGFKQGTPEFDRFQRMAVLDVLSFALASLFPASFFEATLPQPMGYLKDLSEFFFGQTEEDRESAFFGTLPYPFNITQMVLPPSFRYFTSWFTPLITGDWDRFAAYHVWTMFPFGLMARDVKNTIESPMRLVENTTGFPLMRVHQEAKRRREAEQRQSFFTYDPN